MSKFLPVAIAALAGALVSVPAAAGDGKTTRIEPRPFYGATVTIEQGVRVFRPMPPTKHVIVNPDGATPLSLGFNETTVYERNYNYRRYQDGVAAGSGYTGSGYYFPGYRGRFGKFRGGFRGGHGGGGGGGHGGGGGGGGGH